MIPKGVVHVGTKVVTTFGIPAEDGQSMSMKEISGSLEKFNADEWAKAFAQIVQKLQESAPRITEA